MIGQDLFELIEAEAGGRHVEWCTLPLWKRAVWDRAAAKITRAERISNRDDGIDWRKFN